jgi:isoaspartyl peptidase/L-asparaginase-like protein (Ntn-hydrolase superfamily)
MARRTGGVWLAGGTGSGPWAVTHGGTGAPPETTDGAQRAADAAFASLERGETALEAAVAGTVVLEDDPRFNAGTGSNIRLDGRTIQMDASLMTDDGRFAAVAAIERVRNPVLAARLVLRTPHALLAGEGATRFAHRMGLPDEVPESQGARRLYEERLARLAEELESDPQAVDWRDYWNFPGEMPAEMRAWGAGGDTVGTVVRDANGRFAATLSTGGTSVTLYGRVGDVPIPGAGLHAGPAGAVACTGDGEEILRRGLARSVYESLREGEAAQPAVRRAAADFPARHGVGIIAVDAAGWAVASNRQMAFGSAPQR